MSRLIYRMFCCCKFQCSSLLNDVDREDFVEEIAEEYDEIRTDHYDSLKVMHLSLFSFGGAAAGYP